MFLNFSLLKNFHSKKFYFKYSGSFGIRSHRNVVDIPICCLKIRKYSASVVVKNYKYLQGFKKFKKKDFYIFKKNFNTSSKLFKENSSSNKDPKDDDRFLQLDRYKLLTAILLGIVFKVIFDSLAVPLKEISWEELKYDILAKGEAKSLTVYKEEQMVLVELHDGAIIKDSKAPQRKHVLFVPEVGKFEEKLRETEEELGIPVQERVPIKFIQESSFLHDSKYALYFFSVILLAYITFNALQRTRTFFKSNMKFTIVDPIIGETKGVRFSDVAGLKEAKIEILDFVDYLKKPEVFRSLGAKVPKGALLLGPPGCGKTLLAKAVASEANVPFLSMNGPEFVEIIGGLGAARVRNLFKEAKKRSPCIIYIDEIDAIGRKRVDKDSEGETEQTLNQLLVEMDGVVSNQGVVLLASTNRADMLDKALLRPGRFDRHILIDLPSFQERQEIFEHHLKSIYLEHKPSVYSKRMAHLTPGFSGADIANVCNEAALHAARVQKRIVQGDDLEYAVERVVGGTEKRSSARTPEEKKIFAYYEAGRALVGWLSKYGEALLKITIVARTDSPAGWTHFSQNYDKYLYSLEDIRGKMCMGLGGIAAVTLLFNRVTTAGEKDLKKVTSLAYAQVRRFGMNQNVGLMSFDVSNDDNLLKKPYSKLLGNIYDLEARKIVTEAYTESEKILLENKDKLIKLAEELLLKETLNYDDVVKLIGPPAFEGKTFIEPLEFIRSMDQAINSDNTIA